MLRAAEIRVEVTFDWDDELRNHWQDLVSSLVEQVVRAQQGEGSVWVEFLPSTVEEDRQIVMIVQGLNRHLPDKLRQ